MHPFVAEQMVRAKRSDLEREASAARLAKRARGERPSRRRVRVALGGTLVRAGVRLAGAQAVEW